MSTADLQRRKQDPKLDRELKRIEQMDAQKDARVQDAQRALEQLEQQQKQANDEARDLAPESAAALAAMMGNAALESMLKPAQPEQSSPGRDAGKEAEQEEEKDEEQEEEKDKEGGEVERVLPSFAGPASAGGAGHSPWAVGRLFGGDDDDDAIEQFWDAYGWRPMNPGLDLDEEEPIPEGEEEDADPDTPYAPLLTALKDAEKALGELPWSPSLLDRGLRYPARIARRVARPEDLIDAEASAPLLRARALLRFLLAHGEGPEAQLIAWLGQHAMAALCPPGGGLAGATCRTLALAELALGALPDPARWERVLAIAVDARSRALAEQAAEALILENRLFAPAIVAAALGVEEQRARTPDWAPLCHPAAMAALRRAAHVEELPRVDPWEPPPPPADEDADLAHMDALWAELLGADVPPGQEIREEDMEAFFQTLNKLLERLGALQVEIASACIAASAFLPDTIVWAVAQGANRLLKAQARQLVKVGRGLEAVVGTHRIDDARGLSAEAVALAEAAALTRDASLQTIGRLFLGPPTPPRPFLHPATLDALDALAAGRVERLRAATDALAAIDTAPYAGVAKLQLAGLALARGRPHEALPHLQAARQVLSEAGALRLAAVAGVIAGGLLTRQVTEGDEPERAPALKALKALTDWLAPMAQEAELPFTSTAAALQRSLASGRTWRKALLEHGEWCRAQQQAGALSVLKAAWAEKKERAV